MAYTVSGIVRISPHAMGIVGDKTIIFGTINITSYPTSGQALTARDFGLFDIEHIIFQQLEGTEPYSLINIAGTVWAYTSDAGTEVADTTDIGTFSFVAIGTGLDFV